MKRFGIPYARANDDGSVTCPICGARCADVNELMETVEDAITKGAHVAYAQHYEREHELLSQG
jgi:uncharacterized Zn finger protein (UPF0148 family)